MTTLAPFDVSLDLSADTGVAGDGRTADPTLIIDGLGIAGDDITVDVNGAAFSTVVQPGGDWSVNTGSLTEGSYVITAIQTELGVDSDPSSPLTITIVQPAPGTPVLQAASDSGASAADGLTNVALPTFSGSGVDGDTVAVFDTVSGIATQIGSGTVSGGTWLVTATTALTEGANLITAIQSDAGGNASDPSDGVVVTLDSTAPTVTSVEASGSDITGGSGDLGNGANVTFTVTLSEAVTVAGGTPSLTLNDGGSAAYVSGSGSSVLTFSYTVASGDNTADLTIAGSALNGATLQDAAGNDADLSTLIVNPLGVLQIDTSAPMVSSVTASGTGIASGNGDLGVGEVVTLTVSFNEAVTVAGGVPTLTLNDGGTATYLAGSGTDAITFGYTVAAGDTTADLTVTGSALNGATIQDGAGNDANLSTVSSNPTGTLRIDTTAPSVSSVTASGSGITDGTGDLGTGQIVTFTVGFSEAVTVAGGVPTLMLNDGGTATYLTGSGTDALTFGYTVAAGDVSPALAVVASALNGATVQDAAGNAADLSAVTAAASGTLRIDTTAPTISSVVTSGSGIIDGTGDLGAGGVVTFTVSFSKAVAVVGGVPTLALSDGGTATYLSGTGTDTLTFGYTVMAGDNTADLAVAGPSLNGATIQDAAGNTADLGAVIAHPAGTLQIDTAAPAATSVVASGSGITNGAGDLGVGQIVTLTVGFSEAVVVAGGVPSLTLNDGNTALYMSGSGTDALTFGYTVAAGDNATDLAVVGTALNGATIQDLAGNGADLVPAIANPAGTLRIDTTAPTVNSVATAGSAITSGSGDLSAGQTVTLAVNFSETVLVADGVPTLTLNDGVSASYVSGSGTDTLTFSYTVMAGDNTADLTVLGAALNGATIQDAAGNSAELSAATSNPTGTLLIDTTIPAVSAVDVSGSAIIDGNGDLPAGQLVMVTVTLTEAVIVADGVPTLTLNDGGTATYLSGSGTNVLAFGYTVGAGDNTTDLTIVGSILNGATIRDGAGNDADLSAAVVNPPGVLQIDTTPAVVTSVVASGPTITSGSGDLKAGQTITLTVNLSEPVVVAGGVPTLTLDDGGTATYLSGSGTNQLTFGYTVVAGDNTADLTVVTAQLNGATIRDGAGNDADLRAALTNPAGILRIDTTAPTIGSVVASGAAISGGNGDLGAGQTVTLRATFSEAVRVIGGTPTLTLNDGGSAAYIAGSGSNVLTFIYTVAAGENAADLAVLGMALNEATILDGAGNDANLSGAIANPAGTLQIDTIIPAVSSVVASGSGIINGNGDLQAGQTVTMTVNLTEAVTVTGGVPTLMLNDGGAATYLSGSGTTALTFGYTVRSGEDTADLIVVGSALNGATIRDGAGNAANLSGAVVNPAGTLTIDTTAPAATSVVTSGSNITNGNGDLGSGQTVILTVNLSEAVIIAGGVPTLTLNDGGIATYFLGSGTNALSFHYTVAPGQNTSDLAVTASALNGATILDAAGNAANLGAVTTNPAGTLRIDTTAPTVSSVAMSGINITNGNGDLNAGKQVTLTVNLSEAVIVAGGVPMLLLNDGGTAAYLSGSGTGSLTFVHTIATGENTPDLTVISPALNGATIRDAAGNAANLIGAAVNPAGTLQIDTNAPTVSSVATSGSSITNGNGDLGVGQSVDLTVHLTEAVTVGGIAPSLLLNNGGTATYRSGSGTDNLTFGYTVATADDTNDLTVTGTTLTGAVIQDAAGNAANLTGAVVNPPGTLRIDTSGSSAGTGLTIMDTSTASHAVYSGSVYTGPVAGIQYDYITATSDNINLTITTPNWFIHAGSGDDAIDVSQGGGTNVLDGSTGSNFLVGGSGSDTFFVDDRGLSADVWSTIAGFHAGDTATIWGVTPNDFTLAKYDNQGAAGHTGLDFSLTAAGRPNANLTLDGYSTADLANGRLTVSYGTTPDMPGLPGSSYMMIHGN